ncbi:MAG: hypothetical protein EBR88_00095 [Betaproteobacteria bacterium]|nr:hypothetical protein [Betaproteobacteria bacterium]
MSELVERVWEDIRPNLPLRVRVLGQSRLKRILSLAIQEFPQTEWTHGADPAHMEEVRRALEAQVRNAYVESESMDGKYGFAILSIIAIAAISTIVQQLIIWWMNRPKNREMMTKWQSQK